MRNRELDRRLRRKGPDSEPTPTFVSFWPPCQAANQREFRLCMQTFAD
jgi:hypothetical protein